MENRKRYEQYCAVVGKNVIVEEQREDGICKLHCLNERHCQNDKGCQNRYIEGLHRSY